MKVYTINESRIVRGATLSGSTARKPIGQRVLSLGGGIKTREIPMFKKNPPEVDDTRLYGGVIMDAYPVRIDGTCAYALAKPNRESDEILLVITTRTPHSTREVGVWTFDSKIKSTPLAAAQTLVTTTGPKDYYGDQTSYKNVGWHDALVIMRVGDVINVRNQNGDAAIVKYESAENGLVIDTRVRMVLHNYDDAPDGVGTYIKLDAVFPSRKAALEHRRRFLANLYWGKIEMLDGTLVQQVEESRENEDWNE